jgi:acrylyl-CoA reductase (NADPH)
MQIDKKFKALVVRKDGSKFNRTIEQKKISELPKGEVLICVHFSSINYKDILSSSGDFTVTRHFPHTPGIDAAGVIEFSSDRRFKTGDNVIVISFDLGANTPGGFGQYIRVPAEWVMHVPYDLSLRESMIYGTAGFTAGLAVNILQEQNITPKKGPIVITGASGGVGSVAVAILSKLGYSVYAITGNKSANPFLCKLGAYEVKDREFLNDESGRKLLKEMWAGAIDTVGGNYLENILKSTKLRGAVVSVGLVSSSNLSTTVFPFILRGISLHGSGASETLMSKRKKIWSLLAKEWKSDFHENIATETNLNELDNKIDKIIEGKEIGRVIVDMWN